MTTAANDPKDSPPTPSALEALTALGIFLAIFALANLHLFT